MMKQHYEPGSVRSTGLKFIIMSSKYDVKNDMIDGTFTTHNTNLAVFVVAVMPDRASRYVDTALIITHDRVGWSYT